ncbi:uncharacterized protein ACWYII_048474 isoform 2-T2 [Salvelinus alpinus]
MDATILQGRTFRCIQVEAFYQQEHGALCQCYRDRMVQGPPEPSDQLPAFSSDYREVSLLDYGTLEQHIKRPATLLSAVAHLPCYPFRLP